MPLLYSPLYQSIRLILFGALGLSSLTVSAAIGDANTQKTEPLTTDSTGSYASNSVATDANSISRTQSNEGYQEADILNDSYPDDANSANTNNATLLNDTALDSRFSENNDLDITDINEAADSEAFSNEVSNTANLNTETNNQASIDTPDSSAFVPKAITTDNGKLDLNDESIQASLMRLAEFYELTPDTDASTLNNEAISTEANNTHNNAMPAAQTIPKVGRDLRLLPNAVDSAQRCEGQWVYPQSNPNYQRAVNEAGTANGQPAPNVASVPNNQAPLFTESDYGYYNNVNYAELSGNVKIDQGTQHIEAEKVMIDLSNGVAAAQGKVMFTDNATGQRTSNVSTNNAATNNGQASFNDRAAQGGLIGVADSLNYNTETGQSTANDVAFASVGLQAHGYAKRLNKPNESEYELDQVMFSTCPPTNRKWQFEAKSIDLNTDTGRGEAYNTTFRVADIPVFYLPYFNFPIDSRRSSGFLLPSASVSSESGL